MERYAPMIAEVAPLTHNPDVYWHDGAWHFEQMIARISYEREREWAMRHARAHLDHACHKKVGELGWHAYHEEEEERRDGLYVYLRRTLYECPGFQELKLWRVPHAVYTLSLRPQNGPIIDLPLRRLHYHGTPAWGVLHDGVLHVALRETYGIAASSPPTSDGM